MPLNATLARGAVRWSRCTKADAIAAPRATPLTCWSEVLGDRAAGVLCLRLVLHIHYPNDHEGGHDVCCKCIASKVPQQCVRFCFQPENTDLVLLNPMQSQDIMGAYFTCNSVANDGIPHPGSDAREHVRRCAAEPYTEPHRDYDHPFVPRKARMLLPHG